MTGSKLYLRDWIIKSEYHISVSAIKIYDVFGSKENSAKRKIFVVENILYGKLFILKGLA